MRRLILACATTALIIPVLGWAAGAGNPAGTVGKENYGISIEAEEQVKLLEDDLMTSRRYLGKIIWGAADKLDLYARLGASALKVETEGYPDYETAPRNMTWGGGARYAVACLDKPRLSAYVDLQMLCFYSKSTVKEERTITDPDTTYQDVVEYYTRYKYNEIQFSFITKWQHDVFAPYAGFAITNIFGHSDREVTSEIQGGISKDHNDFREDAIPELIIGLDAGLGGSGVLSGEIRLNSKSDLSFFIGLSELWH